MRYGMEKKQNQRDEDHLNKAMEIFSNELHNQIENGKRKIRKSDKEWMLERKGNFREKEDEDEEEWKLIGNLGEECFVCLMRIVNGYEKCT